MVLDDINIKEVFKQGTNLNVWQYDRLRGIVKKLMKYDQNKDCFGDHHLFKLMMDIISHYNLYVVKKNFVTTAGIVIGTPYLDKKVMAVAYVVAKKYRNIGIGSELLGRAIKTCFEECECLEISLSASVDNIPSRKMIEKNHFSLVSEDSTELRKGEQVKQVRYSLDYNQYIKEYDNFKKYKTLFER